MSILKMKPVSSHPVVSLQDPPVYAAKDEPEHELFYLYLCWVDEEIIGRTSTRLAFSQEIATLKHELCCSDMVPRDVCQQPPV